MFDLAKQLCYFLVARKKIWMFPLVFLMLLVGLLMITAQSTALGPFIYAIF